MKRFVLLVLFAGCLLSISPVYAEKQAEEDNGREHRQWQEKHHDGKKHMFAQENLTAEEKQELAVYRDNYRAKKKQLREKVEECRKQLHAELEKAEPDMGILNKKVADLKQAQGAMLDARVAGILEMKAILKNLRAKAAAEKK